MLYFHGFPSSRLEARLGAAAARAAGVRLIACDRPGIGGSTPHPERSIASGASDMRALVAALALPSCAVLGVSGGAPHALSAAGELGPLCTGVVLVCAMGPASSTRGVAQMRALPRLFLRQGCRRPRLIAGAARLILGGLVPRHPGLPVLPIRLLGGAADRAVLRQPAVLRALRAGFHEAFRHGAAGHARELLLLGRPWGLDLAALRCPVTLWHGDTDRVVPVGFARSLAARIPQAQVHVLRGEGHFSLPIRHMQRILIGS